MDEKDKTIQDLRRENERLKSWIDELEDKDASLDFDGKFQKARGFIEWLNKSIPQEDMAMNENKAIVYMVLDGESLSAYVSGNGDDLFQMIMILMQDINSRISKDNNERPMS